MTTLVSLLLGTACAVLLTAGSATARDIPAIRLRDGTCLLQADVDKATVRVCWAPEPDGERTCALVGEPRVAQLVTQCKPGQAWRAVAVGATGVESTPSVDRHVTPPPAAPVLVEGRP